MWWRLNCEVFDNAGVLARWANTAGVLVPVAPALANIFGVWVKSFGSVSAPNACRYVESFNLATFRASHAQIVCGFMRCGDFVLLG